MSYVPQDLGLPEWFFFIRHGRTEGNENGIVAGNEETSLTQAGKEEAVKEAHRIKGLLPSNLRVYSSPLARAKDTARLVFGLYDEIVDDLAEWNVGKWTGVFHTSQEAKLLKHFSGDPENGETREQLSVRALRAVHLCAELAKGCPFVCVAHDGLGQALQKALGMEPASLENSLLYLLAYEKTHWRKRCVVPGKNNGHTF